MMPHLCSTRTSRVAVQRADPGSLYCSLRCQPVGQPLGGVLVACRVEVSERRPEVRLERCAGGGTLLGGESTQGAVDRCLLL
jgi:hypothetical protein